jgi:hypothetical protein
MATATGIGANLVFGSSDCAFSGQVPLAADPKLGPLSANGGIGETMAPLRGSPAVNGAASACPATDGGSGPSDERLVPRPRGAACDVGAFEVATDAAVSISATPDPVVVGGSLTLTATVSDRGSDAASGAIVNLPVPVGTTLVAAPSGCTALFAIPVSVSCPLGALTAGQARTVAIQVRPERTGALSETASVQVEQADYEAADDSALTTSLVTNSPAPSAPGPAGASTAGSALVGRVLKLDRHGNVMLRVSCSRLPGGGCNDWLALYSSTGRLPASAAAPRRIGAAKLLGRVHKTIASGSTSSVRMHLSDRARRLVAARHGRLLARLLLSLHPGSGPVVSHAYGVTVHRIGGKR